MATAAASSRSGSSSTGGGSVPWRGLGSPTWNSSHSFGWKKWALHRHPPSPLTSDSCLMFHLDGGSVKIRDKPPLGGGGWAVSQGQDAKCTKGLGRGCSCLIDGGTGSIKLKTWRTEGKGKQNKKSSERIPWAL